MQMPKRVAHSVAHIRRRVVQRGQQRVKRAWVADLAKRRGCALRHARVGVGQAVEQLVERAALADHPQHADGLDPQRDIVAFGQVEQWSQRRLADYTQCPGRAHPHIAIGVAELADQRLDRRLAQHAQRECRLRSRKLVFALEILD